MYTTVLDVYGMLCCRQCDFGRRRSVVCVISGSKPWGGGGLDLKTFTAMNGGDLVVTGRLYHCCHTIILTGTSLVMIDGIRIDVIGD